ncbi:MAG: glycerol-3-phosphate acyltransferase [Rhodospirillaceae bacterium]|nr:glycerol-3-phosphate acyltransferase [Rhodospirillaceae bacterium]|tara:strand:+ start:213 stop:1229 length:1017 start_codon:yes stop_codon:yes gene_type:complete
MSETSDRTTIGVVGGGAWGTALAALAARNGHDVTLWAREPEVVAAINDDHENRLFLSGVQLPETVRATGSIGAVAADAALVLVVPPAQYLRPIGESLAPHLGPDTPLVLCCKGFEETTGALMSEVAGSVLPGRPIAILSGPTFAAEVARGLPTAVTIACADPELGTRLTERLGSRTFRPYASTDIVGTQVGGSVKNVLAIACGIAYGRDLGDNARAALITRGIAEISRLGAALGGRPETLSGLSGIGDLILTCTSEQSRNFSLGVALGRGRTLADILGERRSVAEGVTTARSVTARAATLGVEMPICAAVEAVLHQGADLAQTIETLLSRPFRSEDGA